MSVAKTKIKTKPVERRMTVKELGTTGEVLWKNMAYAVAVITGLVLLGLLQMAFLNNSLYDLHAGLKVFLLGFLLWIFILLRPKKNLPPVLVYAGLGFLGFSWLSFFFSDVKTTGLGEMLLDSGLVLTLLALPALFKLTKKYLNWFFALILAGGMVQSAWAVHQYWSRLEPRAAGFFFNPEVIADYYPNAFALSSLLFLTLSLSFLFKKNRGWQFYGGVSTVLLMTGLFLSWSRGAIMAWIGVLMLALIIILVRYRTWLNVLKLFLVTLLAIMAATIAHYQRLQLDLPSNHLISKAQFEGSEAATSVGERRDFMLGSVQLIQQEPLWGYGPASFRLIYPGIQPVWLANAPHPHNWFLKLAVERGVITAAFFLFFWLFLLIQYLRNWKSHSETSIFICIGLLGVFAHNLVDFNFNFASNAILLALLGGLLIQDLEFKPVKTANRIVFWVLTMPLAVLIVLSGLSAYRARLNEDLAVFNPTTYENLEMNGFFSGEDHLNLARYAIEQGNVEVAKQHFRQHLDLNPHDAEIWNQLAELQFNNGEFEEALLIFEANIERNGKNYWNYYLNVIKALEALGDQEAIEVKLPLYVEELETYLPLAKSNIHFTAQHVNSEWAIEMAQLLQTHAQGRVLERLVEIELELQEARETFKKEEN